MDSSAGLLHLQTCTKLQYVEDRSPGVELGEVVEVPVLGYGDGPIPPYDFSAVLYSLQQEIESAQPAEGLHLLP